MSVRFGTTAQRAAATGALLLLAAGCDRLDPYVSSFVSPEKPTARLRCSTPLTASGPFARNLEGTATFALADGGTEDAKVSIQAYFPEGRRAGARVFFAHDAGRFGTRMVETVLSDEGGGSFEWSGTDSFDFGITGTLIGPDDGINAVVTRTFAVETSDAPVAGNAELMLCPEGELPNPVAGAPRWIAPGSDIRAYARSPIDPSSVVVSVRLEDGTPVDVEAAATSAAVTVTPRSGAFPPGRTVLLSLGQWTDVMGRRLYSSFRVESERPVSLTATGAAFEGRGSDDRVDGLVALGERGTATTARVTASWGAGCRDVWLAIVSDDAYSNRAPLGASSGSFEGSVPLPGPGMQWLSVHADQAPWLETWRQATPCRIEIAAATLE